MSPSGSGANEGIIASELDRRANSHLVGIEWTSRIIISHHNATIPVGQQPALQSIRQTGKPGALSCKPEPLQTIERHVASLNDPQERRLEPCRNSIGTTSSGQRRISQPKGIERRVPGQKWLDVASYRAIGQAAWIKKNKFNVAYV